MAGRGKKKTDQPKESVVKTKTIQLEQSKTTKIVHDDLDEDNDSVNIKQIEPKKTKKKLDSYTLASTYFSSPSKIENTKTNSKVSQNNFFINS